MVQVERHGARGGRRARPSERVTPVASSWERFARSIGDAVQAGIEEHERLHHVPAGLHVQPPAGSAPAFDDAEIAAFLRAVWVKHPGLYLAEVDGAPRLLLVAQGQPGAATVRGFVLTVAEVPWQQIRRTAGDMRDALLSQPVPAGSPAADLVLLQQALVDLEESR